MVCFSLRFLEHFTNINEMSSNASVRQVHSISLTLQLRPRNRGGLSESSKIILDLSDSHK